ncbi:MAG: hypothetical protein AAGI03_05195 [Pseudomonadota bacterium]
MIEAVIGLFGVVVGAAVTIGADWLRGRSEKGERAKYLAIRTVITLDRYVSDCASVIEPEPVPPLEHEPLVELPPKLTLPDDVDWTSIPPDLCYRILSLPSREKSAADAVSFMGGPGGGDPADARDEHFTDLGLLAHAIAQDLRAAFGLEAPRRNEWDPAESLRARKSERERRDNAKEAIW